MGRIQPTICQRCGLVVVVLAPTMTDLPSKGHLGAYLLPSRSWVTEPISPVNGSRVTLSPVPCIRLQSLSPPDR